MTDLDQLLQHAYRSQQTGRPDEAIDYLKKALALQPMPADIQAHAHNNLAALLARKGRYSDALRHYRDALHAKPDFVQAHYNLGLLLLTHQELDAAIKQFNNVRAFDPQHLHAAFYLGVLYLERNQLDDAATAFHQVLALDPSHIQSLNNLGVIALKREQGQQAVDYFTKALALDNHNHDARSNLAATFMHHDRFENALTHYQELLTHAPLNKDYLYNAGVAQMALGHLNDAKSLFETLVSEQPDHAAGLTNLAAIHNRLGDKNKAIALLQAAVVANPTDESTQFMLKALTGANKNPSTCPAYATQLFDNYALYYESHMNGALHYRLPDHIGQLLDNEAPHVQKALDLGCGTGLIGIRLRSVATELIGVDISKKMLAQAKTKNIYDALIEAEAIAYLKQSTAHYDLIVVADVLPYIGALDDFFASVVNRMAPNGLLLFTTEISPDAPWQLQSSARFSHQPDYIHALAKHYPLKLVHQETILARQQEDKALFEIIYGFRLRHAQRDTIDGL